MVHFVIRSKFLTFLVYISFVGSRVLFGTLVFGSKIGTQHLVCCAPHAPLGLQRPPPRLPLLPEPIHGHVWSMRKVGLRFRLYCYFRCVHYRLQPPVLLLLEPDLRSLHSYQCPISMHSWIEHLPTHRIWRISFAFWRIQQLIGSLRWTPILTNKSAAMQLGHTYRLRSCELKSIASTGILSGTG